MKIKCDWVGIIAEISIKDRRIQNAIRWVDLKICNWVWFLSCSLHTEWYSIGKNSDKFKK